jgi:protein-S-isoprenylcysteine O-methyltransferase Ste14
LLSLYPMNSPTQQSTSTSSPDETPANIFFMSPRILFSVVALAFVIIIVIYYSVRRIIEKRKLKTSFP